MRTDASMGQETRSDAQSFNPDLLTVGQQVRIPAAERVYYRDDAFAGWNTITWLPPVGLRTSPMTVGLATGVGKLHFDGTTDGRIEVRPGEAPRAS